MSDKQLWDDKIISLAPFKSPMEISEEINGTLTPSQVAARVKEVLASRDWLSVLEKKQVLIEKLWNLVNTYEKWANEGNLRSGDMVIRAIREIRQMLAEDDNSLNDQMLKITDSYAERMGMAIAASFSLLLEKLQVPEAEAQAILVEVMPVAFGEIDASHE